MVLSCLYHQLWLQSWTSDDSLKNLNFFVIVSEGIFSDQIIGSDGDMTEVLVFKGFDYERDLGAEEESIWFEG